MGNLEEPLKVLEGIIPVGLEAAIKKATSTKIIDGTLPYEINKFISTEILTSDCEILARLQSEFININFIFSSNKDITPFLHLFKNDNEGIALTLRHDTELLSEEEFMEMQSFSTDERIEILITAIKNRLRKIKASKENRYVICYGGSETIKDTYGDSELFKLKLVHRLSILEFKY